MKSHRFVIPVYEMPIRLRLWVFAFTATTMVLLAFLRVPNILRTLHLNGNLLHFLCFFLATGQFYFIIDVERDAQQSWFWRHSNVIFTIFTCCFCGGILSEIVHSQLPEKKFEFWEMVANLLGSSIGLYFAYQLERQCCHLSEISRFYQPLAQDDDSGPPTSNYHSLQF